MNLPLDVILVRPQMAVFRAPAPFIESCGGLFYAIFFSS